MFVLIPLFLVVDQINGRVALVEVDVGIFLEVRTRCLPDEISEGDRLAVWVRRRPAVCPFRLAETMTQKDSRTDGQLDSWLRTASRD